MNKVWKRSSSIIITLLLTLIMTGMTSFAATKTKTMDQLTKYYQENQLEGFKKLLPSASEKNLESLLEQACDHQRDEFVNVILECLPTDFNADVLADKMMKKGGSYHSLLYILEYISEAKKQEIFDKSYELDYTDIIKKLYEIMPNINADEMAEKAFADDKIVIFQVFKNDLSSEKKTELTKQAEKEGKTNFFDEFELTEEVITSYQKRATEQGRNIFVRILEFFKGWLK